ncbi:MAG: S26 family signal peptidase [Victivallaceae bacterium]
MKLSSSHVSAVAGLQGSKGNVQDATFFASYVGVSMNPTLREPEIMEIMPYGSRSLRAGDVAFFLLPESEQPIVHRIMRVTAKNIFTIGDNNSRADVFLLPPENIKGRVVAAWRGQHKRRVIAGGLYGLLTSRLVRLQRVLDCKVSLMLHPLYHALSNLKFIARILPASFQPRVFFFNVRGSGRIQLLMGRRVIGRYDGQTRQWHIRRPFKLFVNSRMLPIQQEKEKSD